MNPGAANNVAFVQQPTNATAGNAISPAVTVRVRDAFGNTITTDNSTQISLAIGSNPGSGTLTGGGAVTVVNGVATFSNSEDRQGRPTRTPWSRRRPGSRARTSSGFNIAAGTASQLAFTSINSGVTPAAGTSFNVQIQSQDSQGNAATVGVDTPVNLSA